MTEKTYSLSGLVARIAGQDTEAAATLARQIRAWTDTGFLPVSGLTHSGRGRHRRYSEAAVYIAAVLSRMARMGLGTGALAQVSRELQRVAAGEASPTYNRLWRDAVAGSRSVVAAFEFNFGDNTPGAGLVGFWLYEAGKTPSDITSIPATAAYALTVIFQQLND